MSSWRGLAWSLLHTRQHVERLTRAFTVAAPTVGNQAVFQVPGGTAWRILSIYNSMITSATATSRYMYLYYSTEGLTTFSAIAGVATPASSTGVTCYAVGASAAAVSATYAVATVGIPDMWLPPQTQINVTALYLQAGDQIGSCNVLIDELIPTARTYDSILAEEAEMAGEQATLTITPIGG